jgi:hypothetical protein
MATPTYTLIDSEVLASAAASVTFTSIPADYRDLVLVAQVTAETASSVQMRVRFNGDTGSNYNLVYMFASGASPLSGADTNETYFQIGKSNSTNTTFSQGIMQVMDYSATDKHKTCLNRANDKSGDAVTAGAARWANTAAITSISIIGNNNYGAGSTFYLYGISA